MRNISIYWDHDHDVVGVIVNLPYREEGRHEEPINGRDHLEDWEVLAMVDEALG